MGGLRSTTKTLVCILVILLSTLPSGLCFSLSYESSLKFFSASLSFTEQNVIITDSRFYEAAYTLALFHTSEGLPSVVVNTSWIYAQYLAAEDPPFKGYGQGLLSRLFISTQYNYVLAKKIISFLRDNTTHPNLEYVTLFGDGLFIPASYYVYSRMRATIPSKVGIPLPGFFNNRIATDFFYTSPDYNILPDYKVGRIPVSTVNEATAYVEKIQQWSTQSNWDWFQNVYVAGGEPNLTEEMNLTGCYVGEMIADDAINQNYFQGMNVNKLFLTEGSFTKNAIENMMKTGQAGFLYVVAHGNLDRWQTNKPERDLYVLAEDILQYPENLQIPIVVSVACMNGAYDTSIAHPFTIGQGANSLGESILFSQGAGIAYIGTTRATLGSPILYLDKGEVVITKERGIAGMLTYFFEAYHKNITTLGDLTYTAMKKYVDENSFPQRPEKDEAFVVLVSFVLLGDPVLRLPLQQQNTRPSYQQPHLIAQEFEGITTETNPRPWYFTNTSISIEITTNSPQVAVKLININTEQVIERENLTLADNTVVYTFSSALPAQYLIRASGLDGKEGWLYCSTKQS